ncbi:MAG: transmembrane family protein [Alphaproteobacteria bacterium]|nr:transmembrane family protein [Alphaproteobacteria bacterium]
MKHFNVLTLFVLVMTAAAIGPAGTVCAREVTVDLASARVDITTGFTGATLVLHGVKKEPGDLAIVVRGPERRVVVRRKEQVLGMWMNRSSVEFLDVPSYYDYALSVPEPRLAEPVVLADNEIGLNSLDFQPTNESDPEEVRSFKEALIWNQISAGLYPLEPGNVVYLTDNFFRATFDMPSNVPTGEYTISTYLFQSGNVKAIDRTTLRVAQTGFSADLYDFAHNRSLVYGLMAVFLAIASGWAANTFLRRD